MRQSTGLRDPKRNWLAARRQIGDYVNFTFAVFARVSRITRALRRVVLFAIAIIEIVAERSLSRISSQYLIATNRIVLALAGTICVASTCYAQSGQAKRISAILPDVALLIRGPFGEYSYKLTGTTDDSVTLEEFGGRRMRLDIRQIPDKKCVFVSTSEDKDGVDVAQLDLTKFDGTYQLWEACRGPSSAPPENRCTYSLHFSSQKQAFCSSRFQKLDFDLNKIPFPDEACHPYALGAREKKFYFKYIDAYERIKEQCGGSQ